jgi:hypothetical protein
VVVVTGRLVLVAAPPLVDSGADGTVDVRDDDVTALVVDDEAMLWLPPQENATVVTNSIGHK